MTDISRREFAALVAAAPFAYARDVPGAAPITADDVIARIKKNIGVEWKPDSVDAVKAGDPSTVAKGIVTTSMATMAVLQQAVKAGANVVITAQPTFYGKADLPASPTDPVVASKSAFIARNNLVVFRLSDHWRGRQPDPLAQGLAAALGWTKYRSNGDPQRFEIPTISLEALVSHVKGGLRSRGGVRVVGDPGISVRRVGLLAGTTSIQAALKMLPDVDAIVAGEVREWESVEYVRDKVFSGEKKGLILVGRVVSEEPGMDVCASWLKTFVSEVPIRHISAGDPYWRS
ncbi:MAG: Nif3-like dinuclear metal center hexameric protein [Vicinamibacterales bacterium]|nr:Nif3-like dinuclear metal center hexameric protein [Vicinamibacterales bacterium]